MNGRQRTMSDLFWRDPSLANLSIEDKATLGYCLTSPSSNTIGVYPIVPRVCAAEMGWTSEQFGIVLTRLDQLDLVRYSVEKSWIWVRIWFQHNHAAQLLGPKLIDRTLSQIRAIPDEWRNEWVTDFGQACPQLFVALEKASIPYRYPSHRVSDTVSATGDTQSANNVSQRINNVTSGSPPRASDLVASAVSGPGFRGYLEKRRELGMGGKS